MIYLHYKRSECQDVRIFRNYEELNAWLACQNELAYLYPESETIKVTKNRGATLTGPLLFALFTFSFMRNKKFISK